MPMTTAGDVIRVVMVGEQGIPSETWEVSLAYRVTAINENADFEDWTDALLDSLRVYWTENNNNRATVWPSNFAFTHFRMLNLSNTDEERDVEMRLAGAASNYFYAPFELCYLVLLRTGQSGRSYLGKAFWPATNWNGVMTNGRYQAGQVQFHQQLWNRLRFLGDAFNNGTLTVWSRKLSTPTVVFNTITTSAEVQDRPFWRRSRRHRLSGVTTRVRATGSGHEFGP